MNYELAKKLKDAVFACQHQMDMDTGSCCVNCPWNRQEPKKGFKYVCFLTLSELIEACGDELVDLTRTDTGWTTNNEGGGDSCDGKTPEEAVVNLWIALNKK